MTIDELRKLSIPGWRRQLFVTDPHGLLEETSDDNEDGAVYWKQLISSRGDFIYTKKMESGWYRPLYENGSFASVNWLPFILRFYKPVDLHPDLQQFHPEVRDALRVMANLRLDEAISPIAADEGEG